MEAREKNLTDAWPGKASREKILLETLIRNAAALKHEAQTSHSSALRR